MTKKLLALALIAAIPLDGHGFNYKTFSGTFPVAEASPAYTNFSWNMFSFGDYQFNLNFDTAFDDFAMRWSYPRQGTVYLDIQDGTTSGSTNWIYVLDRTNVPPSRTYYVEMLGFTGATTSDARVVAAGMAVVSWSVWDNTNSQAYTNPNAGTTIGPPTHTIGNHSSWPFVQKIGDTLSGDIVMDRNRVTNGLFYGDGQGLTNINVSLLDHGTMAGLSDDDHTNYVQATGDTLFGTIDANAQYITNVGLGVSGDIDMNNTDIYEVDEVKFAADDKWVITRHAGSDTLLFSYDGDAVLWLSQTGGTTRLNANLELSGHSLTNIALGSLQFADGVTLGSDGNRVELSVGLVVGGNVDLAANSITNGSFAGDGASVTNLSGTAIASGTVADARIASTLTRDAEWDTFTEINAASTDTDAVTTNQIGSTVQAWDADLDLYALRDGGTLTNLSGVSWWDNNPTDGIDAPTNAFVSGYALGSTDGTNLLWVVTAAAGVTAVSNSLVALFGDADTALSNSLVTLYGDADTALSNSLAALWADADTSMSNSLVTLMDDKDTSASNSIISLLDSIYIPTLSNNIMGEVTITFDTEWDTFAEINAASTDTDAVTTNEVLTDAQVADAITVDEAGIAAAITRDTEWDTLAEINAASTDTDAVTTNQIGSTVQAWDAGLDTLAIDDGSNLTNITRKVTLLAGTVQDPTSTTYHIIWGQKLPTAATAVSVEYGTQGGDVDFDVIQRPYTSIWTSYTVMNAGLLARSVMAQDSSWTVATIAEDVCIGVIATNVLTATNFWVNVEGTIVE